MAKKDHPEMNKTIVRRYYEEALNPGDLDHAGNLVEYGLRQHSTLGIPDGLEGLRSYMSALYAAFPDLNYRVEDLVAQGDEVAVRVEVSGTQTGTFEDRPPSGRKVAFTQLDIYRLEDRRIVEHWDAVDRTTLYRQLGRDPTE